MPDTIRFFALALLVSVAGCAQQSMQDCQDKCRATSVLVYKFSVPDMRAMAWGYCQCASRSGIQPTMAETEAM